MADEGDQLQSQPLLVLNEGAERVKDRDAQELNITAAKQVAEAVRTTLGPNGMDKMLVESGGDITITNDGVTILETMDVDNPTAEMVVEIAKTQEEESGDGTTTAVVVAGELLKKAEEILDQNVHPSAIVGGYRKASERARNELDELAVEATEERLLQLAKTAMTGRNTDLDRDHLAELVLEAVTETRDSNEPIEELVRTEALTGGDVADSHVVKGAALDEDPGNQDMPTELSDAKVLLLDEEIGVEETEADANVSIDDPTQLQEVLGSEEKLMKEKASEIAELADAVFSTEDIDDLAHYYLARQNVLALDDLDTSDMEFLSRVTGGGVVSSPEDASSTDVGEASIRTENELLYIEGDSDAVTLVLRGGTDHVVAEIERGVKDAVAVVSRAARDGKVVGGGGAPEIELSLRLRDYAESVEGREQLAVEAFADALDVVPRTLAGNSGDDPIDAVVELRNAHEEGDNHAGFDADTAEVKNALEDGVVESVAVKQQAISSAEEVSNMILRIDDIISAGDLGDEGGGGGPPAGGMGGLGGMM